MGEKAQGLDLAATLGRAHSIFALQAGDRDQAFPDHQIPAGGLDLSPFDTAARRDFEKMIATNPVLRAMWHDEVVDEEKGIHWVWALVAAVGGLVVGIFLSRRWRDSAFWRDPELQPDFKLPRADEIAPSRPNGGRVIEALPGRPGVYDGRPLLECLQEAAGKGQPVELFAEQSKEKYAGTVLEVLDADTDNPRIRFVQEKGGTIILPVNQLLAMRGRGAADNMTENFVHPRLLVDPAYQVQFPDKSINKSGRNGDGMMVLVDFTDPALREFLDTHIDTIRTQLDGGLITEADAAQQVWKVVRDHVPFDVPRVMPGGAIPNKLYRLGDFAQTGVCNERGMLVQVAMQYVGVRSRMEKGPFGGRRHAWVRAFPHDGRGQVSSVLILDPQEDSVAPDPDFLYRDDGTSFARDEAYTVVVEVPRAVPGMRQPPATPLVTPEHITLELLDRYPQLEESAYRGIVDALSEEIFTAWEREGAAFTSERPGLVGLPPEEFIERSMDRLLGRLEQDRHRTVAAAIRASERGIRKDRDTRDLAGRIRAAAERAAEIGRHR